MKCSILLGFIFAVAAVIGFKSAQHSWDGVSYYNVENISYSRDPAAIRQVFDFSHLEGEALQFASKKRLLNGAILIRKDRDVGFELGHFVMKGSDGKKRFACQSFDKVVLELVAEDFAVNGERTTMEVRGNCQVSANVNTIDPFMIPFSQLFKEKPKDAEFSYYGDQPVQVRVEKLVDHWPKRWALKSVKLQDSENHAEISVSVSDLPAERARDFHFSVQ